MLTLLNVLDESKRNMSIPLEKLFEKAPEVVCKSVETVIWYASLKPDSLGADAVKNETVRYEEIQIIIVKLTYTDCIYDVARVIYKSIKYPCLLVFRYQNKFSCSVCQFRAGTIDYNNNILHNILFSHWVYPDLLTPKAELMLEKINSALGEKSNLLSIYTGIVHAIENFKISGISKAHVDRLLRDMLGRTLPKSLDKIMKYCTPYKIFFASEPSIAARYDKSKRRSDFRYSYDYEDIWYCFMQYEPTKKVIVGRRYRDIEELVYKIDSKLEDSDNRW